MNTDLGILQWITGLVVGFFYEDLRPKEKEWLLFGGCFFIAMFMGLYDRHLILEDEREKRTRLEDLDRKVGELKGNLKSADDEAKKKDNEITVLKDQIKVIRRDLSAGLKDATDVANTREKEMGVLKDQLEEARRELSLEDRKLHQLKTDLKAANDKVDTKNEEIIGLRNQLKVIQGELSVEVEKVDQHGRFEGYY
ncbi:hypothetical protein CQW23_32811 [Capsicum baccatum]|uniref:Uncharacterized protein n=1 Tax=Capsicum baccatum TaxID=33114 RepID=A0A2G2V3Q4_CAPBA|nr:hypothetical protein CQW23_32811 [Capsicum baccatum]